MTRRGDALRVATLVVAALAFASPARGDDPATRGDDPCAERMLGPAAVGVREAGLDQPRSACVESALRVDLRGVALIDTPDFYGTLAGALALTLRGTRGELEWELGARAVDLRFAQNAVVTATELGFGPIHAGVAWQLRLPGPRPLLVTPSLRVDLPWTDTGYDLATTAVVPAVHATLVVSPRLQVHGHVTGLLWLIAPVDNLGGRAAIAVGSDAGYRGNGWLAVVAGGELQGGWYRDGIDHLLVRAGARFALGCRHRVDLAVAAPLYGRERTDLVFTVGVTRDHW